MKQYVASTQCGQKHFVESDSIITAKRMFTEMLKGFHIIRIEAVKPDMFIDQEKFYASRNAYLEKKENSNLNLGKIIHESANMGMTA